MSRPNDPSKMVQTLGRVSTKTETTRPEPTRTVFSRFVSILCFHLPYSKPETTRPDPTRQPATKSESWLYYGFGCEEDEKKKGNIDTGFILFSNLETHMVNFIIYFVMSPKMMKSLKNTSEWNKQHLIFFSAYTNALCKSRIPIFEKLYHQKKDLL